MTICSHFGISFDEFTSPIKNEPHIFQNFPSGCASISTEDKGYESVLGIHQKSTSRTQRHNYEENLPGSTSKSDVWVSWVNSTPDVKEINKSFLNEIFLINEYRDYFNGFSTEEWIVICGYLSKGLKLHYVESGSKSQELLLFVHGFPDFWFSWKHQIAEFSKDYWVVAPDMRGYGETEKSKKVFFYKIEFLVNDIRNLILALGREKFTLIAHDWGGVVAHYFIRIHPQMINKYVLMNTVFHPKLGGILFSDVKQFLKSWYILMLQIPYYGEYFFLCDDLKNMEALYEGILSPEEVEIYKFTFGSYDKIKGPINYYRANFKNWRKNGIPKADDLNKRNVPGLYIHGEDDVALTLNMAFMKSFQDVQNVRLAYVSNAGHFVHLHSPEKVNNLIRNFLKSSAHSYYSAA